MPEKTTVSAEELSKLRQREKFYRFVCENLSDVIFVYNVHESRYEFVSPNVFDLVGYPPDDFYRDPTLFRHEWESVVPRPVAGIAHPDSRIRVWLTAKDGTRKRLEFVQTPIYGIQGNLVGVIGVARDVTDPPLEL